ncbi:class I SAM-dependent methyltransferase [Sphingomonas glaciei]|uniref:Class I SAM-dependent methyltransferase n=1 Tax=Sphingomonas glaciei TaxID=2938948 RepID=A0ABY5MX83_9SPHN|nr:class I SAM-dependent methyltransferase [Sphingomonas glaciei]UUR08089.1 class I SAM-dependent methyltransferase [Sphingomonas glaciei]
MENEGLYSTQYVEATRKIETLNLDEYKVGAPFAPLPRSFYVVDPRLSVVQPKATDDEIAATVEQRGKFRVGDYAEPYVADVLRAFRLLRGKKTYLEIGIFDRGNLSYVASLLDDDAILIGVDIQADEERDAVLRASLKPSQQYHVVIGSSRDPEVVAQVGRLLGERKLDGIFIDGDHTAYGAMCDHALYEQYVADDGVILFHDSVWEGDETFKGVCDALDELSRVEPVYMVDGSNPVRRFSRPLWRDSLWGVVAVVFASDQKWR